MLRFASLAVRASGRDWRKGQAPTGAEPPLLRTRGQVTWVATLPMRNKDHEAYRVKLSYFCFKHRTI